MNMFIQNLQYIKNSQESKHFFFSCGILKNITFHINKLPYRYLQKYLYFCLC